MKQYGKKKPARKPRAGPKKISKWKSLLGYPGCQMTLVACLGSKQAAGDFTVWGGI